MAIKYKQVSHEALLLFDLTRVLGEDPRVDLELGKVVSLDPLFESPVHTLSQAETIQWEALQELNEADEVEFFLADPAEKVAEVLLRLGLNETCRRYFDININRAPQPFANHVGIHALVTQLIASYGSARWFTRGDKLALIKHLMTNHPMQLRRLLKECYLFDNSPGWANNIEREVSLAAVDASISEASRLALLDLWESFGGSPDRFDTIWCLFTNNMMDLVRREIEYSVCRSEIRQGKAPIDRVLRGMRIGHNAQQIYDWALRQFTIIQEVLYKLVVKNGYTDWSALLNDSVDIVYLDRSDTLKRYETLVKETQKLLTGKKVLPKLPAQYTFRIRHTPDALIPLVPIAMVEFAPPEVPNRSGVLNITPPYGDPGLIFEHTVAAKETALHEIFGHLFCDAYAPRAVPSEYRLVYPALLLANEGVAVSMEQAFVQLIRRPLVQDAVLALRSLAWRFARIIFAFEYHTTARPLEVLIAEYAERSGMSLAMARSDVLRATLDPWEFIAYALGAAGVQVLGDYLDEKNSYVRGLRYMIEHTAGHIPPHLAAWAEGYVGEPESFNYLVDLRFPELIERKFHL
ncbi:MAG: DUF885 family protein [Patescibacteria group bacterium]